MRAVAISLGAVMSLGPILLAGTAVSADWKATEHRVTGSEIVTETPAQPLFYGGMLKPITVVAQRPAATLPRSGRAVRCPDQAA